ncbi:MAG: hypothetical protein O2887_06285 [Bacteroidetes bacterium]|nr:hypothetical protein [Bacteroidota bacterium]MDA1120090.1 hypothetical protein [Bacteroidota bacterium]
MDTVSTTYTADDNGAFLLRGLPEGEYRVAIEPNTVSNLAVYTTEEDVEVKIGEVKDLGILELQ